jgi:hypothetical protein
VLQLHRLPEQATRNQVRCLSLLSIKHARTHARTRARTQSRAYAHTHTHAHAHTRTHAHTRRHHRHRHHQVRTVSGAYGQASYVRAHAQLDAVRHDSCHLLHPGELSGRSMLRQASFLGGGGRRCRGRGRGDSFTSYSTHRALTALLHWSSILPPRPASLPIQHLA